jgi:hypothetical protein
VADQAALLGLLTKVSDLGLPLLSPRRVESQGAVIMTNSATGDGAIRFEKLAAVAVAYGWPLEVPQ